MPKYALGSEWPQNTYPFTHHSFIFESIPLLWNLVW